MYVCMYVCIIQVGSTTEGIDVRSVGNSLVLKQTALIEAFNLKAAIEYVMRNFTGTHFQKKKGDSLVTLHGKYNRALSYFTWEMYFVTLHVK